MRTVRSKCELSQHYPIIFSRDGTQEISKIQWRGKHSHQYTFLMQHLLVYYELWLYATLWFTDCTTAVYGEMYQLHKLLMADVSTTWLVSGKSHPLATMRPIFSSHFSPQSVRKWFKQWARSNENHSFTSRLLINEVQANPNIMRTEMHDIFD